MRVKLQLVLCTDDGCEETVTDVITLQKDHQRIEHLGLTLAEAKQLLTTIQRRVLTQQIETFFASHHACDVCGAVLKVKGAPARSSKCSGANAERISCCKPVSKTLNGELDSVFKRWYPDLQLEEAPQAA
jgi:hypothetical protein